MSASGPTQNMTGREATARLLAAAVVSRLVRIVRGFVLARLLSPEVFGAYALIGALIGPLASIANLGLASQIAREQDPDERLVATADWLARATALVVLAALVVSVTIWTQLSGRIRLLGPGVTVAVATALFLLPQVDVGVIQQRRKFSDLAALDLTFDVVWALVAIALAVLTRSVWALAVAELVAHATRVVYAKIAAIPKPPARRDAACLRRILRFSTASTLGSFIWAAVFAAPAWILQRHVNDSAIGEFTLAYTYSQIASTMLGTTVARVSLPAIAGARDELRVREAWRYAEALTLVLAPVTGLLACAGAPALVAIVGERWVAAGAVLTILVWGMGARVAFPFSALAQVKNRPSLEALLGAGALTAFLILELTIGWTTPLRAAVIVASAEITVAVAGIVIAARFWGETGRAWRLPVLMWLASIAAAELSGRILVRSLSDIAFRGALFVSVFGACVLGVRGLRERYLVEWDIAVRSFNVRMRRK